ncbi:MAG: BMP family ABC transporter substrate-binding protein [Defluviitaleaceae bacterium]|nr:BMP family ABC transporter substrate-binding protein [Defluviitaleaceae bacterium]MCL2273320.1 BMP family ABC transporter substrate-binding protein [Defluviitaleaceae bacterium]
MKKVLKIVLSLALLAGMTVALAACGNNNGNGAASGDDGLTVFLVSHSPAPASTLDDGSFNQGSADGIRRFVNQHGGSFNFMQPHEATNPARIDVFIDAIEAGADVLVLPGFHFAASVYQAQSMFPDTYFIVVDTGPDGPPASNLVGVLYAEQESGFLAGYAAVREGYTQLGFMGGNPVPAVVAFGLGFLQGAEHAAAEMGLAPGTVVVNYMYLGGFGAAPEHTATANGWYAAGTEVIFVAAGAAGNSVAAAAEAGDGRWMIGVDVDQSGLSDRILTSAMKALENSVYTILNDIQNNRFRGGNIIRFDASTDGVALPMATSRFSNFTQAQYENIFRAIAGGQVRVQGLVTSGADFDPATEHSTVINGLSLVTVNEM